MQQKPLWCDHSNLTEAPSVISVEVELRQTLSLLRFSFNKRTAASAQLEGGEGAGGGGGVLFNFFPTKLEFSVLPVSGNGSSFMKQMVFGVVTAMDLLTFVSRNDKKRQSSSAAPTPAAGPGVPLSPNHLLNGAHGTIQPIVPQNA